MEEVMTSQPSIITTNIRYENDFDHMCILYVKDLVPAMPAARTTAHLRHQREPLFVPTPSASPLVARFRQRNNTSRSCSTNTAAWRPGDAARHPGRTVGEVGDVFGRTSRKCKLLDGSLRPDGPMRRRI
jgi:hypothetical protein